MPEFMLVLDQVGSVTEARFAAGEGFTHIVLSAEASQDERLKKEILESVAGVEVLDEVPENCEYIGPDQDLLPSEAVEYSMIFAGVVFESPGEERPGWLGDFPNYPALEALKNELEG